MNIWILNARYDITADINPWIPGYDVTDCMIIRADTEEEARTIASNNAGDENRMHRYDKKVGHETSPWFDPAYSTCEILSKIGERGVILRNYFSS